MLLSDVKKWDILYYSCYNRNYLEQWFVKVMSIWNKFLKHTFYCSTVEEAKIKDHAYYTRNVRGLSIYDYNLYKDEDDFAHQKILEWGRKLVKKFCSSVIDYTYKAIILTDEENEKIIELLPQYFNTMTKDWN